MKSKKKINLHKHPYRGILTEIAIEQGVTPQAIYQAIKIHKSPRILELFKIKRTERETKYASVQL